MSFPTRSFKISQVSLERVALESFGPRIQDQLGVIGRLASGIIDLIRDLPLAEGSRFIPGVEDHGQTGRAAIIYFQPFFEGDRLDQMPLFRLGSSGI